MKHILPVVIFVIAAAVTLLVVVFKPKPEESPPEIRIPAVEYVVAEPAPVALRVKTQGTVVPETQTQLSAEVSGVIVSVSDAFESGGFFSQGDVLLHIDPIDYKVALQNAQAALARARAALELEEARATQARQDWERVGQGEPDALVLRKPQLAEARANVQSAEAALMLARKNLDRTMVRAPYDGRVRGIHADLGQRVNMGAPIAVIYSVEYAEVRLPLTSSEVGLLDLPMRYRVNGDSGRGPAVSLTADYGGRVHRWEGYIDRLEGEVDERSRLTYAVARVPDPYARGAAHERPPLKVGMFVEASIEGHLLDDAVELPRWALRPDGSVLVVSDAGNLSRREVQKAFSDAEHVVVGSGLAAGEKVVLTPLAKFVEGMRVNAREYLPESERMSSTGRAPLVVNDMSAETVQLKAGGATDD